MEKVLSNFKTFIKGEKVKTILPPLMAILAGLLVGFLTLVLFNPTKSLDGFLTLLTGGFSSQKAFAKTLSISAPLILTGLSVGIAYKCGLFNIGAAGQFVFGGFGALLAGIVWGWPWFACLFVAAIFGLLVGAIPGILKAYLNVNEVITTIMVNWITLYLVIVLIGNLPKMHAADISLKGETAKLKDVNVSALLPDWGLADIMSEKSMSIAFFIAIFIAIIVYIVVKKTTFGFKLTACGFNKHASQYAGINSKKYIVYVMLIAGTLSGIGGGLFYLQGAEIYKFGEAILPSQGFDGIAVALLGANNPMGIIFSSFFISYLKVGGSKLQPDFLSENIDMIISIILYFSALSLFFKNLLDRKKKREATLLREKQLESEKTLKFGVTDVDKLIDIETEEDLGNKEIKQSDKLKEVK